MMPIAMIKGWSPTIRSSIERDSSLLGLLAKLRNNFHHNLHSLIMTIITIIGFLPCAMIELRIDPLSRRQQHRLP